MTTVTLFQFISYFLKVIERINGTKDVVFQQVYENTIVTLVTLAKSPCKILSFSLFSYKHLNRKLEGKSTISTTVKVILRSNLRVDDLRLELRGTAVTSCLLKERYNVTAKDPVLEDLTPTTIPMKPDTTSPTTPNSMIAAISVGIFAFIILIICSLYYYFRVVKKVVIYFDIYYVISNAL